MNRRILLRAAAFAAPAVMLGCTPAQAQSTLQTLAAGWATLPGLLSGAGVNIPPNTTQQVNAAIADLESKASQIGTAVSAPPTTVQTIVSDISLVSSLLSPFFPAATTIGSLVVAGVSLVGTLLTEAGLTGAAPTPPGVTLMAPADALRRLRQAATK